MFYTFKLRGYIVKFWYDLQIPNVIINHHLVHHQFNFFCVKRMKIKSSLILSKRIDFKVNIQGEAVLLALCRVNVFSRTFQLKTRNVGNNNAKCSLFSLFLPIYQPFWCQQHYSNIILGAHVFMFFNISLFPLEKS